MRRFGGLCDCECTPIEKPSEGRPFTATEKPTIGKELAADQCCDGTTDECCTEEEDEPAKQSWWGRYLKRLNKATGGQAPKCH